MVGTPFMAFYCAGAILGTNLIILIKIFLLLCLYIVLHYAGQILYDDRLMSLLPLSIYLSTKIWMYITWLIYIVPYTNFLTSFIFLTSSALLWYCFIKSWRGDPGVITATQELRFRVMVQYTFSLLCYMWFEAICNCWCVILRFFSRNSETFKGVHREYLLTYV